MSTARANILICSTSIATYDRRIQRIARSLSAAGYEVKWISRSTSDQAIEGINHLKLDPLFKSGFLFYAFFNFRLFLKLLFQKYDVIYSVDLDTILPCYLVSKIRSKKIVFDAHEYFTEVPELINRKGVKRFWESIAKFCLPKIENNITVGPALSKIFTERYKQEYEVIRNIGEMPKATVNPNVKKNKLVYLGVVNKGRGLELAIEALVNLPEKRLKIIGDGDLFEDMKKLAKNFSVESRVEFVGYVLPENIGAELEDCYLALNMLMPMSKSYYYSLANKYFDYIHFGIPTVNMSFPEYVEIDKSFKTGILVEKYEVNELISAIKKMDDKSLYNSFKQGIEEAKSVFRWEIEQQKLIKFMHNILTK